MREVVYIVAYFRMAKSSEEVFILIGIVVSGSYGSLFEAPVPLASEFRSHP